MSDSSNNNYTELPDAEISLKNLRDLLQSKSAQLQIKGRALSNEELAGIQKIDRILVSLDEIIQFLPELSEPETAFADAEALPVVSADKSENWQKKQAFAGVFSALQTHRAQLESVEGVIAVRPGYHFVNGYWTNSPAIIVSVFPNLIAGKNLSVLQIPEKIGDIFVDVVPATPEEQLQFRQNANAAGAEALNANPISSAGIERWKQLLDGDKTADTADFAENVADEAAGFVPYTKPAHLTLARTTVDKMTCHVSPDLGWKLLSNFLAGVKERFTVAIYDFKAEHIEEVLRTSVKETDSRLNMIMHNDGDANEKLFAEKLEDDLKDKFDTVWASNKKNGLFKTSYHTKVAVRDGKAFWLSSGNWTRSSQPDVGNNPSPDNLFTKGNREWNVIIEDEALAKTFEDYILFDISESKDTPAPEALPPMPDLLIPIETFTANAEAFAVTQPFVFQAETFEQVDVQPLLTPDNYIGEIIDLIKSAEQKLYLQFSYIYSPSGNNRHKELIEVICDKIKKGLDVKIIVSSNQKTLHTQELSLLGMKGDQIFRKQKERLHNKGIIVDSKKVVVGSHNWSPAGVLQNRDASLIIYDVRVTKYYESIFLWDWQNNTSPIGAAPGAMPQLAEGDTTPMGMVRLAWHEFYEE